MSEIPTIAAPLSPWEPARGRTTEPLNLLDAIRRYGELCAAEPGAAEHGSPQEADEFGRQAATLLSAIEAVLAGMHTAAGRANRELNERRAHECVPTQHAYDRACAALWKHRGRADALAAVVAEVACVAEKIGYDVDPAGARSALLGLATRLRGALLVDEAALRDQPHPQVASTSGCVDGGNKTTPEATPADDRCGEPGPENGLKCQRRPGHLDGHRGVDPVEGEERVWYRFSVASENAHEHDITAVTPKPDRCPVIHLDGVTRCHDDAGHGGDEHGGTGPEGPKTWSRAA